MSFRKTAVLECLILAAALACSGGCVQQVWQEGYEVLLDVRCSETGQPLSEWVAESRRWSYRVWSTEVERGRPTSTTTAFLRVLPQSPSHSVYPVEAFGTSQSIWFFPGVLGYGGRDEERPVVHAVGYDTDFATIGPSPGTDVGSRIGSGDEKPPLHRTYVVRPWCNRIEHQEVGDVLLRLADTTYFEPYEALRDTPEGSGVPRLYEYYIRRFEAICEANPDLPVDAVLRKTVQWLRDGITGKRRKSPFASRTARTQDVMYPRMEDTYNDAAFRVVALDAGTGQRLDEGVFAAEMMEIRSAPPYIQPYRLLCVDRRSAEKPYSHVPGFGAWPSRDERETLTYVPHKTVYVVGYAPASVYADGGPERLYADGGPETLPSVLTYRLRWWDNDDVSAVGAFVKRLEDDRRFKLYEGAATEGFSGVIPLYRYLLARYEALRPDQKDGLSPKARRRVEWLRERAAPDTKPDGP